MTNMNCRSCGSSNLWQFLDLGVQTLPRFPSRPDEILPKAPLVLGKCSACHLVQLRDSVERDLLFDTFWYRSGISSTITRDLREIAKAGVETFPDANVGVDIGC